MIQLKKLDVYQCSPSGPVTVTVCCYSVLTFHSPARPGIKTVGEDRIGPSISNTY